MMRLAIFIEGTFIPERDGASAKFAALPHALAMQGVHVVVFHVYRGWSDLRRISAQPFVTYFFTPATYYNDVELLAELLRSEQVDIIQMNDLETVHRLGFPLRALTGARLVYDALYHSQTLFQQLGLPADRQSRIQILESAVAKCVDHVMVLTSEDLERWQSVSGVDAGRVSVVPFGMNDPGRAVATESLASTVVFLGNCHFEPNRRAVVRIVTEIAPRLAELVPGTRIRIVGPMPSELATRCIESGFEITGEVEDVDQALNDCTVGLAPITEGSGVRVKLLRYLSLGLPAVSTSLGAEGLSFPALFVENAPDLFAGRVAWLVANPEVVASVREETGRLVRRAYTWDHVSTRAVEVYRRISANPRRADDCVNMSGTDSPYWLDEMIATGRFDRVAAATLPRFRFGIAKDGHVELR